MDSHYKIKIGKFWIEYISLDESLPNTYFIEDIKLTYDEGCAKWYYEEDLVMLDNILTELLCIPSNSINAVYYEGK